MRPRPRPGGRRASGPAPLHATCGGRRFASRLSGPSGSASRPDAAYDGGMLGLPGTGVLLATAVVVAAAPATAVSGGYQCYISDAVNAGFVPDTVQAEGVVDCSGYGAPGSVRFSARLLSYDRQSRQWHTVKTKSRRYTRLKRKHHLAAAKKPCKPGTYRGVFRAVLRDAAGRRVSVNVQKLGNLRVLPNCVVESPFRGAPSCRFTVPFPSAASRLSQRYYSRRSRRRLPAATIWGLPHRLSPVGARNVAVAVDARGHGVVAWARPDQRSEVRIEAVIRSGRAWRPVRQLGLANTLMGRAPMVAVSGRGDAFVAWVGRDDNALHVAMHAPARPWTSSILGDAATTPWSLPTLQVTPPPPGSGSERSRLPSARATGTGAPQLLSRPPRSPPITRASR